MNQSKIYGVSDRFVDEKLSLGFYSFSLLELIESTGLSPIAAKNQLLRLGEKVTRVSPRQPYYLIVTPEDRVIGAPPVERWIDDYFTWLNRPYYLALLSAATEFGSSPQAIQEVQIMTDLPIREIKIGLLRVRFFTKSKIKNTAVQHLKGSYAPLKISTPESTVFDMVRYAVSLGGIERVAETIQPIIHLIRKKELISVLDSEGEVATAQRLGFVLETIKADKLANVVADWLPKRIKSVPITTHYKGAVDTIKSKKWGIVNNSKCFLES